MERPDQFTNVSAETGALEGDEPRPEVSQTAEPKGRHGDLDDGDQAE